jgi:KamA family protein
MDVPTRYAAITASTIERHPAWARLTGDQQLVLRVVSRVLPFRVNDYVLTALIDWDRVPDDPIFQLTFPQRGMLSGDQFAMVEHALKARDKDRLDAVVAGIRSELNPHPAGQRTMNVPMLDGEPVEGLQHKYPETVLYFPAAGQTCHAYCTFCFRWPQFVGDASQRFSSRHDDRLRDYLRAHHEVTDLLVTGGDPMVMGTAALERLIDPILRDPDLSHVSTIRFGTKSLAYWPARFTLDQDADGLLRLFERIVASGRALSIQAHASHPVELEPEIAREAIRRIRATGATIRMQSPCIRHVNDDPSVWATLWGTAVRLGCIPYYMFVERDTGARRYFELTLARCHEIFRTAYSSVSGLSRTVRGPSMSATPGKVHVLGRQQVFGLDVFVLEYLQCRRPELVRKPFLARFDPWATWFDQLRPATAADEPFFPQHWPDWPGSGGDVVPLTVGGAS